MQSPRARRLELVGVALVAIVGLLAVLQVLGAAPWQRSAQERNPFEAALWVDPASQAAQAAASAGGADAEVLARLADVSTATWITPEATGPGEVRRRVHDVALAARDDDAVAVFVVYGIADRDCTGQESAGGLTAADYPGWVEAAAAGAEGIGTTAVVIEPDALAALQQCQDPQQRLQLLRGAVDAFVDAGVTTYLDAGHSAWLPADVMATRLRDAGVERARGFSTNVAFYAGESAEQEYAEAVRAALDDDARYVIDTGRSGAGGVGAWCNPPGQALGPEPQAMGDAYDARLWIKPPGESDGTCNGGPPAGVWWPERAVELARAAGW